MDSVEVELAPIVATSDKQQPPSSAQKQQWEQHSNGTMLEQDVLQDGASNNAKHIPTIITELADPVESKLTSELNTVSAKLVDEILVSNSMVDGDMRDEEKENVAEKLNGCQKVATGAHSSINGGTTVSGGNAGAELDSDHSSPNVALLPMEVNGNIHEADKKDEKQIEALSEGLGKVAISSKMGGNEEQLLPSPPPLAEMPMEVRQGNTPTDMGGATVDDEKKGVGVASPPAFSDALIENVATERENVPQSTESTVDGDVMHPEQEQQQTEATVEEEVGLVGMVEEVPNQQSVEPIDQSHGDLGKMSEEIAAVSKESPPTMAAQHSDKDVEKGNVIPHQIISSENCGAMLGTQQPAVCHAAKVEENDENDLPPSHPPPPPPVEENDSSPQQQMEGSPSAAETGSGKNDSAVKKRCVVC